MNSPRVLILLFPHDPKGLRTIQILLPLLQQKPTPRRRVAGPTRRRDLGPRTLSKKDVFLILFTFFKIGIDSLLTLSSIST